MVKNQSKASQKIGFRAKKTFFKSIASPAKLQIPRLKEFNTIADVVKCWRHGEVGARKVFPLYKLVESSQREALWNQAISNNKSTDMASYSDAWWKSSGHKSALGRLRRSLVPLVKRAEDLCSDDVINNDSFWKCAIEQFINTWGNEYISVLKAIKQ